MATLRGYMVSTPLKLELKLATSGRRVIKFPDTWSKRFQMGTLRVAHLDLFELKAQGERRDHP